MTADFPYRIPFLDLAGTHRPLQAQLDAAVAQVCRGNAFVEGPEVAAFEESWADYCQVPNAVGVASGADAVHVALRALGVGRGEEVILPANAFIGTAEAVVLAGATPVFCDVDERSLLMDPMTVDAVLSPRTAAVIVVHHYGHVVDMEALSSYTRDRGLALIEDATHAPGASFQGRPVGSWGDVGCFDFQPDRPLGALGSAGVMVCRDAALAERCRSVADHGRDAAWPGHHPFIGTRSKLDTVQAAALSVKLPHLDDWNAARRHVVDRYARGFEDTAVRMVMPTTIGSVHHRAVVRVPNRTDVAAQLRMHGICTKVHYPIPCHHQPPYWRYATEPLPAVEQAANEVLSLPLYPHLADTDIDRIAEALVAAVEQS